MAWLKRKQKNRRFGREELLDVKLRTRQTRVMRLRVAGIGLSISFALVVMGYACWQGGKWLLDYLIYKNDAFAIQQIEVQTDDIISTDTVRRWAMVKPGENLLALDLTRVKRDLELQPSIQFVAVERVLPHTLKLRISEREPLAQTMVLQRKQSGEGFAPVTYQFDAEGFTMTPLDSRLRAGPPLVPDEKLPMIVGVQAHEVQLGKKVESPQLLGALQLLSTFDNSSMNGLVELQRIDVGTPEILQVTTSHGAEVTFSLHDFDLQFRRWRLIHDQYQKWGAAVSSLDLSISNNLPVRWVAATGLKPITPKATKPSRTRKKNV